MIGGSLFPLIFIEHLHRVSITQTTRVRTERSGFVLFALFNTT